MIIRYFETLRNMLNTYQNNTAFNNTAGIKDMHNLEAYYELCKTCESIRLYHRCHPELRDPAIHARARDRIQHLHSGRVLVQDGEEDRHLHRLPNRGSDRFHHLLAAFPERVEPPNLQD